MLPWRSNIPKDGGGCEIVSHCVCHPKTHLSCWSKTVGVLYPMWRVQYRTPILAAVVTILWFIVYRHTSKPSSKNHLFIRPHPRKQFLGLKNLFVQLVLLIFFSFRQAIEGEGKERLFYDHVCSGVIACHKHVLTATFGFRLFKSKCMFKGKKVINSWYAGNNIRKYYVLATMIGLQISHGLSYCLTSIIWPASPMGQQVQSSEFSPQIFCMQTYLCR